VSTVLRGGRRLPETFTGRTAGAQIDDLTALLGGDLGTAIRRALEIRGLVIEVHQLPHDRPGCRTMGG
jgi:hypothetical protein